MSGSNTTGVMHTAKDGKGILITETAMQQLARLCREQGSDKLLRVGVRSGGCSGMSYTMDFVPSTDIQKDDELYDYISSDGDAFKVVCDPKSLLLKTCKSWVGVGAVKCPIYPTYVPLSLVSCLTKADPTKSLLSEKPNLVAPSFVEGLTELTQVITKYSLPAVILAASTNTPCAV